MAKFRILLDHYYDQGNCEPLILSEYMKYFLHLGLITSYTSNFLDSEYIFGTTKEN